jgi:hypothetical protein
MPGFTDDAQEFEQLVKLIRKAKIDMIQWRNLNYDPLQYFQKLGIKDKRGSRALGIKTIIFRLKKMFPRLRHGYFNVSVR